MFSGLISRFGLSEARDRDARPPQSLRLVDHPEFLPQTATTIRWLVRHFLARWRHSLWLEWTNTAGLGGSGCMR
jgi:hypothetical protein